ncbi:uncharacterized protein LOC143291753 [Babylonia areolata]|uniref:uncharacterized protein LOC143291753 n=1 Tax=Babylonia areolata TaxID=304850 RepID=UPI003FD3D6D2
MREEIEAAVHFVGRVITSSNSDPISSFSEFKSELSKVMEERFKGHWHDDSPGKGQGYRSIRFHPTDVLDPVLSQAAVQSKFSITYLRIPVELTMWVDPKDVSCRFGDLKCTYCTVLKDEDNQASTLDVDELLENAKAVYNRQQNFVVSDGPQHCDIPFIGSNNDLFNYGMQMNGFTDNFMFPGYGMYSPWHMDGGMADGSTPPPLPYNPATMGLCTPPRKNGKNGHFRKGSSNGTGRGTKHHHHNHHHHHHHHNGGDANFNQNHASSNNHNNNGNTPNGSMSNGRSYAGYRFQFQWMKGTKNFHQFYSLPNFRQMHQLETQQTPPKKRQNSESDKDAK